MAGEVFFSPLLSRFKNRNLPSFSLLPWVLWCWLICTKAAACSLLIQATAGWRAITPGVGLQGKTTDPYCAPNGIYWVKLCFFTHCVPKAEAFFFSPAHECLYSWRNDKNCRIDHSANKTCQDQKCTAQMNWSLQWTWNIIFNHCLSFFLKLLNTFDPWYSYLLVWPFIDLSTSGIQRKTKLCMTRQKGKKARQKSIKINSVLQPSFRWQTTAAQNGK